MEISERMLEFVRCHANDDVNALRLRYAGKKTAAFDFNIDFALTQIEARRKARKKLPSFIANDSFLFPSLLSEEQATNESVARFHTSLITANSKVLDLTGGLGIDDFEFCKAGMSVTSCEIDKLKYDILCHNARALGLSDNIILKNCNSIDYVKNCNQAFDVVYTDPARRDDLGARTHGFVDCQPDITSILSDIKELSQRILIKSSPLLDLSLIHETFEELQHIYVVCFKGECKEVLIDIRKDSLFSGVTVVDIEQGLEISRFHTDFPTSGKLSHASLCNRKKASEYNYLYEPNAGIMKTGAWTSLIEKYPELYKADYNTHIFLSDTLYSEFPGRIMKIFGEPDKKALKALKGTRMNIVSRNHPLSAPKISSKYAIISGDTDYLYAFRYLNVPSYLITKPI
ncbi:MAG: hypothetical protein K2N48_08390 [Muribaculaceae bacterium]|nr:hypothetical protein [Muribaculaceae bacterium]